MNVLHHLGVVVSVADVTIPVLPHPQLAALRDVQPECGTVLQYPVRSEGFPALHDRGKLARWFNQHMDMVGHHAPRVQVVALAMEMQKRFLYLTGDFGMPQGATAHAVIQPLLDPPSPCCFAIVLRQRAQLVLKQMQLLLRQAVGESIADELEEMALVEMRNVPTRIPSGGAVAGSADVLVGS